MEKTESLSSSGLNSHFSNHYQNYDVYVSTMREVIAEARTDLNDTDRDIIIDSNAPAVHYPKSEKKPPGVLLIHGLLDSCAIMNSLFEHFKHQGYLTKSLLLPGHGTRPADLLQTSYQDWLSATHFAIESFQQEVSHLTVVGYSLGGCLATHASFDAHNIDALILFAPAYKIKNKYRRFIEPYNRVKDALPFGSDWFIKKVERDFSKYGSISHNAVRQGHQIGRLTSKRLLKSPLEKPTFFILSTDDETICPQKVVNVFKQSKHRQNRLLIYDSQQTQDESSKIIRIPSCIPSKRIINFSHICLTVSPNHVHYGKKNLADNTYLGAMTSENTLNYPSFERLTYNPHFSNMIKDIDQFILEAKLIKKHV